MWRFFQRYNVCSQLYANVYFLGMINYLFGVQWEDNFRFNLIDQKEEGAMQGKTQADSQTEYITAYTIYSQQEFALPYTFTIIDTPGFGDTRGI